MLKGLLLLASALSVGWALFVAGMGPLGLCDWVFVYFREELQRTHTFVESQRIMGRLCGCLESMFQRNVLLACAPAAAMNLIWCVWAVFWGVRHDPKPKPSRATYGLDD